MKGPRASLIHPPSFISFSPYNLNIFWNLKYWNKWKGIIRPFHIHYKNVSKTRRDCHFCLRYFSLILNPLDPLARLQIIFVNVIQHHSPQLRLFLIPVLGGTYQSNGSTFPSIHDTPPYWNRWQLEQDSDSTREWKHWWILLISKKSNWGRPCE